MDSDTFVVAVFAYWDEKARFYQAIALHRMTSGKRDRKVD